MTKKNFRKNSVCGTWPNGNIDTTHDKCVWGNRETSSAGVEKDRSQFVTACLDRCQRVLLWLSLSRTSNSEDHGSVLFDTGLFARLIVGLCCVVASHRTARRPDKMTGTRNFCSCRRLRVHFLSKTGLRSSHADVSVSGDARHRRRTSTTLSSFGESIRHFFFDVVKIVFTIV